MPHMDLAYRFSTSCAQISNIIITCIHVLDIALCDNGYMKYIPTILKNQQSLPQCFTEFPNICIVLDCTEIKICIPSKLDEQNQTWSSYKHSNTFKALVGVAPNGVVTYCSELYGGCTSDKAMTVESNIMKTMSAGGTIMVDKGFKIHDLAPQGVSINIPPFLLNPQFTEKQCIETR